MGNTQHVVITESTTAADLARLFTVGSAYEQYGETILRDELDGSLLLSYDTEEALEELLNDLHVSNGIHRRKI